MSSGSAASVVAATLAGRVARTRDASRAAAHASNAPGSSGGGELGSGGAAGVGSAGVSSSKDAPSSCPAIDWAWQSDFSLRWRLTTRWSRARVIPTYSSRSRSARSCSSSALAASAYPSVSIREPDDFVPLQSCARPSTSQTTFGEKRGGCVLRPASSTIGNSSPFAPWIVRIRTASSSGSGATDSIDARALVGLLVRPLDEAAQRARAGVVPGPCLVEEEPDAPPVVAGPSTGDGELEEPTPAHDRLDRLAHAAPPALVPERAQLAEPPEDGMLAAEGLDDVVALDAVVPCSTRGHVLGELEVAAPERRRTQRGDDRDPVARVVDGGEDREEVADLGGREQQRLALDAHRDARALERVFEPGEHRAGGDEDGDVGVVGRTGIAVGRAHAPAVVLDLLHDRRDVVGFGAADRLDEVGALVAEHRDAGRSILERAPVRVQLDVRRLHPGHVGHQQSGEDVVHEVDDRRDRAEVLDERRVVEPEARVRRVVDAQVGTSEAVDRLLGVTDDDERTRQDLDLVPRTVTRAVVARRQQRGELDLQRVGVLELVEEDRPPPPRRGRADSGIGAEQLAREDEQVVELERAVAAALVGEGADPHEDVMDERAEHGTSLRVEDRLARVGGRRARVAHGVDAAAPAARSSLLAGRELGGTAEELEQVEQVEVAVREGVAERDRRGRRCARPVGRRRPGSRAGRR